MIRLAFCTDNFQIGGTELNAVRWVEQLDPARFRQTVVHFERDGPLRARFQACGMVWLMELGRLGKGSREARGTMALGDGRAT